MNSITDSLTIFSEVKVAAHNWKISIVTPNLIFLELVACWWDPLSHTQTVRLVNLVRHYAVAYPSLSPSSKPLRELTHAIINKIRDAIDNDIFIPMFPKK